MAAPASGRASGPDTYDIQGCTVTLPVVVRDASSANAAYLVDVDNAQRLLPTKDLEVVNFLPRRTLLSIAVIDYRDNDLGDYNEISITLFVRERSSARGIPYLSAWFDFFRGRLPTYIHRLPVNQSFTCQAGQTIWGFPKTVDDIEIEYPDGRVICTWRKEGRHVFTFTAPRGGRQRFPDATLTTYSYIGGELHRTCFVSGAEGLGFKLGGADLELGDHPIAEELRSLGLPKRALMTTWMGKMHGRFEGAEKKV
jgi:hypothetical protein